MVYRLSAAERRLIDLWLVLDAPPMTPMSNVGVDEYGDLRSKTEGLLGLKCAGGTIKVWLLAETERAVASYILKQFGMKLPRRHGPVFIGMNKMTIEAGMIAASRYEAATVVEAS